MKQYLTQVPSEFINGFARIREELDVPAEFPAEVEAAARAAVPMGQNRRDARDLPFIAIDPPGAADLDQALVVEALGYGYRVNYAIADLGAFIRPGDPIDQEARNRGSTRYSPDLRTPLHPTVLSEDRASLLAGVDRPALLWSIDLDAEGHIVAAHLERATVQVREAISYHEAQRRIESGDALLAPLQHIGQRRIEREIERGGISLNLPSQRIIETERGYELDYERSLPVEDWNSQISLLTGIVAGRMMAECGVGLLRTLPPTSEQDLTTLRHEAAALGVPWPDDMPYAELIRSIQPTTASRAAFLSLAARSLRGAGYLAVNGDLPQDHEHGAIASVYAHVTAPLRRLVDRFSNEILLALYADETPPAWAVEALDELPGRMGRARSRESALQRALIDYTEAMCLAPRVGEQFRARVVELGNNDRAKLHLLSPAVITTVEAPGLSLGAEVDVRLRAANPADRTLVFEVL